MITKFLTEVKSTFNPFSVKARPARLFLAFLPPNARKNIKIETRLLSKESTESSRLYLKFKDGLELDLKPDTLGLQGILEEVDRHSRIMSRKEELGGQ